MHSGQGSYLEFTVPFVIDASGYTTKVNGQMMHLDATTSLKFRSLLQCETLEVCFQHFHNYKFLFKTVLLSACGVVRAFPVDTSWDAVVGICCYGCIL